MSEPSRKHRIVDLLNRIRYGSEHEALAEYLIDLEDRVTALEKLAHRHATEADVAASIRDLRQELHHQHTEMDLGI